MSLPLADLIDAVGKKGIPDSIGINSIWVIVAGCLVMFMQAGFACLEIGFSRAKNAGTVIAKILTNFSIAGLCYWAVGFAFAFGGVGVNATSLRAGTVTAMDPWPIRPSSSWIVITVVN